MTDYDHLGPLYVRRTPWRTRLIVWPGRPFHTLPFPYLFHRWEVCANHIRNSDGTIVATSAYNGYFLRGNAERQWPIGTGE